MRVGDIDVRPEQSVGVATEQPQVLLCRGACLGEICSRMLGCQRQVGEFSSQLGGIALPPLTLRMSLRALPGTGVRSARDVCQRRYALRQEFDRFRSIELAHLDTLDAQRP